MPVEKAAVLHSSPWRSVVSPCFRGGPENVGLMGRYSVMSKGSSKEPFGREPNLDESSRAARQAARVFRRPWAVTCQALGSIAIDSWMTGHRYLPPLNTSKVKVTLNGSCPE